MLGESSPVPETNAPGAPAGDGGDVDKESSGMGFELAEILGAEKGMSKSSAIPMGVWNCSGSASGSLGNLDNVPKINQYHKNKRRKIKRKKRNRTRNIQ